MKSKKLFLALLMILVVAVGSLVVACEEKKEPLTEGAETGTYVYDADDGEYLLTLNSGERFNLILSSGSKSGTYALSGTELKLTFNYSEDGELTAVYANDTVKFTYNNKEMEFVRRVEYTVAFNSVGGSSIGSITVVNGRTVAKPADPAKEGHVFAGWYKDEACTVPFAFGSEAITSDATLYAKWIEVEVGVLNYTINFDLNYEGASAMEAKQTLNGKLYEVETPIRSGYIFGGWWLSDSEEGDKLTNKYTDEMVFGQDTTLYAVWNEDANVIMPSVSGNKIEWSGLGSGIVYSVTVTDENGEVVASNPNNGSTTFDIDWSLLPAGEYKIEVAVESANKIGVRYYTNKALNRVSLFSVVGSNLTWVAVDNAESYYITIKCGNDSHVHTMLNNGESTSYDFSSCAMKEGGIEFIVTAMADGYATSVSKAFVVNKELSKIAAIAVNETAQTISWSPIENATGYVLSVISGDKEQSINLGNKTSYCYKEFAGNIELRVMPVANGYNSPAYTSVNVAKAAVATPANLRVDNTVISWDAVNGATGYTVYVDGNKVGDVTESTIDLASYLTDVVDGSDFAVTVVALGTANSLPSDELLVRYNVMYGTLKYNNSTVTWRPVAGADRYVVKVNGKEVVSDLRGVNSYKVALPKAGKNTISVYYYNIYDEASSEASIEVTAYTINLNPDNGEDTAVIYAAVGDELALPSTYVKNGYDFNGWYDMLGGSKVNGVKYTADVLSQPANLNLYADWKAKTYTVTFVYEDGDVDSSAPVSAQVTYGEDFTLPTPENVDATYAFTYWVTEKNVPSSRVANAFGESYKPWSIYELDEENEIKLYASWTKAFNFNLEDGKYTVQKNDAGIHKANALTIPSSYKGIQVAIVGDFSNCANLYELRIPNTVNTIESSSFEGCSNLTSIDVYDAAADNQFVQGPYSSIDGVLIVTRTNQDGSKEVAFVPENTSGTYVVPTGVTAISSVFAGTNISEIVIPSTVTAIREGSFKGCSMLRTVTFKDGGSELYVDKDAFADCVKLRSVVLPARFRLAGGVYFYQVFAGSSNLARVAISSGNTEYKSKDAIVFSNDNTDTILYYPEGRTGEYSIPTSSLAIGAYAFYGNASITSVTIPSAVVEIQEYAFANCSALTSVVIGANVETIGSHAFFRCYALQSVTFDENSVLTTIGTAAFGLNDSVSGTVSRGTATLTGVVLPQSLTTIGDYAFMLQYTAISNLNIPNVTSIGAYAFYHNDSIKSADLRSVGSMGGYAFSYCSGLNVVIVGTYTCEEIQGAVTDSDPFYCCYYLYKVINLGTLDIKVGATTNGCIAEYALEVLASEADSKIKVTEDGLYAYTVTQKTVTEDEEEKTVDVVTLVKYLGDESEIVLPQASVFGDYDSYVIGSTAFRYRDNSWYGIITLTTITVPDDVAEIEDGAFTGCDKLTVVYDFTAKDETGKTRLDITAGSSTNGSIAANATNVYTESGSASEDDGLVNQNGFKFEVTKSDAIDEETGETVTTITAKLVTYEGDDEVVVLPEAYVEDGVSYRYTITASTFSGKTVSDLTIQGVDEVPASLFYVSAGNTTLTKLTVIGNGETTIGASAFAKAKNLKSVELRGVKEIGAAAFAGDKSNGWSYAQMSLTSFKADETLESIGASAFAGNYSYSSKLAEVEIPGVVSIAKMAFQYNDSLKKINLPSWEFTVESAKTSNYNNIFQNCTALTSVTLGDGVEAIGYQMFQNDKALTQITLSNNVKYIGKYAFGGSGLTSITLPDSVETIDQYAFSQCMSLTTVVVGRGVTSIGNNAFGTYSSWSNSTCQKLLLVYNNSTLDIEAGAATHGNIALNALAVISGASSEVKSVVDEDGFEFIVSPDFVILTGYHGTERALVTPYDYNGRTYEIAPYAFYDAGILSVSLGKGVTTIGNYAFASSNSLNDNARLRSVDLNEGLETIGNYAFNYSSIYSIEIPSTVTSIGTSAFANCSFLSEATIWSGVIGKNAFYYDQSLSKVIIGAGVTEIGDSAFSSDSKLFEVYNLSELDIVMGESTHGGVAQYAKSVYTSLDAESMFIDIDGYKFTKDAKGNVTLVLYSGTATKIILPEFPDEDGNPILYTVGENFMAQNKSVTSVTIPTGTAKVIGKKAFYYMPALTTLVIGDSVEEVKESGFAGYFANRTYDNLSDVTLGKNIKIIGKEAFKNHDLWTGSIELLNATEIGEQAFYACGFTSVTIGKNVSEIPSRAFYNCKKLTEFILKGATTISDDAFQYGYEPTVKMGLTGEEYKELVVSGFANASGSIFNSGTIITVDGVELSGVSIPDGVTSIGSYVFAGYDSSETIITIPASVTSIGAGAFEGVNIAGVKFLGTLAQWQAIEFASASANPLNGGAKLYIGDDQITELTLSASVKAYTYAGISGITKVTLNSGITEIGTDAFKGASIDAVYTTAAVWNAIDFASYNANPISGGAKLYFDNVEVTELTLSANVNKYAYVGITLSKLTVSSTVTSIGTDAFKDAKITEVYASDLVSWLNIDFGSADANPISGGATFYVDSASLTSLELNANVKAYTFNGLTTITSIVIDTAVTSIGADAFKGTTATVYYKGTETDWASVEGVKVFKTVYYFLKTETEAGEVTNKLGNYWHYVEGVATPWLDEWVVLFSFEEKWIGSWCGQDYDSGYYFDITIEETSLSVTIMTAEMDYETWMMTTTVVATVDATGLAYDSSEWKYTVSSWWGDDEVYDVTGKYTFSLGDEYGDCVLFSYGGYYNILQIFGSNVSIYSGTCDGTLW